MDWLHINSSAKRLASQAAVMKKVFVPSPLSLPPVQTNAEDDALREEAEVLEAEKALNDLDALLAEGLAEAEEEEDAE